LIHSLAIFLFQAQPGNPEQGGWKYSDFLSVTLTALGLMLAILAIGLGVAAIFGYRAIIDLASRKAEEAALKRLSEYFEAEKTSAMLKEAVLRHVQQEADKVYEDLKITESDIERYPGAPESQE
jgi:hypothetical protein